MMNGVIGQRVKAVLCLLNDSEKKLEQYKEELAGFKAERDTLAEKMRCKAEERDYEGEPIEETLAELTIAWAEQVNKYELQDRMKKKCEKSVNSHADRFRALCLNAFGLDGQLPFEGKDDPEAHLKVLVADLVGGDMLAKPYGDLGIVTVDDVLRLSREKAFPKFVKGGNLTQGQASYLLGCTGRYLDTTGQKGHGLPSATGKTLDHYFASTDPKVELSTPPEPAGKPAEEDPAGDRFIAPKPQGAAEPPKKGKGKKDKEADSGKEAPGASDVRKSVLKLISGTDDKELCEIVADRWLMTDLPKVVFEIQGGNTAGINPKEFKRCLESFWGIQNATPASVLRRIASWWNDAGEAAPHMGERAISPESTGTPSLVVAQAIEAIAAWTNSVGTRWAYEIFEHLEYLRPKAFVTLCEMSPTLSTMAKRGWRDRDPRTNLTAAELEPNAKAKKAG